MTLDRVQREEQRMTATANKAQLGEIVIRVIPDESPDTSWLKQDEWKDRLEAYQAGEFGFVGVTVQAEIKIPYGKDWIITTVESPGLWGIEDDSGNDYFRSVVADELGTLRDMLESLNVEMPETVDVGELKIR